MNRRRPAALARIRHWHGLLGDWANLDFTALPRRGDHETLQRHWSGTRGRTLLSLSALLARDPDSGLPLHADSGTRRETQESVPTEFPDFARRSG